MYNHKSTKCSFKQADIEMICMFYGVKEREYIWVNKVFFLLLMPNLNDRLIDGGV